MALCEGYSMVGTSGVNGDAYYISPDKTTFILADGASGAGNIAAIGDSPAFFIHNDSIVRVAKPKKAYYNLVEMGLYSEQQLEEAFHKLPEHMWSMFGCL